MGEYNLIKITGIIVEYNPFHNGHLYHIEQAKQITKTEGIIAVMSGNFVQRGEPAIIEKFSRAKTAVMGGVNLVLELPSIFSFQDAGGFAFGAVSTLERTGVVSDLVFGSESADINKLMSISRILFEKKDILNLKEKGYMKKGYSYPNARKFSLRDLLNESGILIEELTETLEKSNDILGLEYLISLLSLDSAIVPHTIMRKGASYNEENFKGRFSSATSIRRNIFKGNMEIVREAVPSFSFDQISKEMQKRNLKDLSDFLGNYFLAFFSSKNRD